MALDPKEAQLITSGSNNRSGGPKLSDRHGRYVVMVHEINKVNGYTGKYVAPRMEVLESEAITPGVQPWPAGSIVDELWSLTAQGPAAEGAKDNMTNFFASLFNLPAKSAELTTATSAAVGESGSEDARRARGYVVMATTYNKVTKTGPNAGKERTYARFEPIPKNSAKEVEARRVKMK